MTPPLHDVCLALGANIGDRAGTLSRAVARLDRWMHGLVPSRVYASAPLYVEDQPIFLNMAVRGRTALAPHELLDVTMAIEEALGRVREQRYGPRQIDIDILYYDHLRVATPRLAIPHPLRAERRFVMAPLADLAPDRIDAETGLSIRAMLEALPDNGDCRPVGTLEAVAAAARSGGAAA